MWSASDPALTQRNHEPLLSQCLKESFCIGAAAGLDATGYTSLRGLPRTRQAITLRESLEEVVNQGLIVIMDQHRARMQHAFRRRFHHAQVAVVYPRPLGRIPTAHGSR